MSGFVFNPAPEPSPAQPEAVVANDGWFPDVSPAAVRAEISVRDGVLPARLRAAIVSAIITVANDLTPWRDAHLLAGFVSLAAVPAPVIGGESRLVLLYRRAICAFVKVELVERYRDVDTTGAGQREVADLAASLDELRRDGRHAIRDMLGRTRTTVDLI